MKKVAVLFFLLFTVCCSFAQSTNVNPVQHIGDTITIKGRIYAGYYLVHVKTKPTFLNIYDSSPTHYMMLRIDSSDRDKFPEPPEKYFLNKNVSVTGLVTDYKGVPLLKISDSSTIMMLENDSAYNFIPATTGRFMTGREFNFGKDSLKPTPIKVSNAVISRRDTVSFTVRPTTDSVRNTRLDSAVRTETLTATPPITDNSCKVPAATTSTDSLNRTTTSNPVKTSDPEGKAIQPTTQATKPTVDTIVASKPSEIVVEKPAADSTLKVEKTVTADTSAKVAEAVTGNKTADVVVQADSVSKIQPSPKATAAADTTDHGEWIRRFSDKGFEKVNNDVRILTNETSLLLNPTSNSSVLAYLQPKTAITILYRSDKWSYISAKPNGTNALYGFVKNKKYKNLKQLGQ